MAAALWAALLNAQGFTVTGEIQLGNTSQLGGFYVELYNSQDHTLAERVLTGNDGRFHFYNATPGWYSVRVLAAPGGDPIVEAYKEIVPGNAQIVLQLPSRSAEKAPSGIVSLHELKHPVKNQALRCIAEAQRYIQKDEPSKAVAKLEEAVSIDPEYRDAHTNLGAEYARAGRLEEAMRHFRRALEIGPPNVIIYSNLAWASAALRRVPEAEGFARKAIALDASNAKAHLVLGSALAMQPGKDTEAIRQLQIAAPDEPKARILIELLRARR
ncbi:MAG TPA: tetratricopeptide repeat protein [Bryobacteraceae bacterium]